MVRSAVPVALGIVTIVILSFAIEFAVDALLLRIFPSTFPTPQALSSSNALMAFTLAYSVVCAGLGGYVTAYAARKSELRHAVATAIVQEILTVIAMAERLVTAPRWVWICNLTLVPLAIMVGGKRRARARTTPSHAAAPSP